MRHFLKEKNQKFQVFFPKKSILRFLSLRYSADFRRSRLVENCLDLEDYIQKFHERTIPKTCVDPSTYHFVIIDELSEIYL